MIKIRCPECGSYIDVLELKIIPSATLLQQAEGVARCYRCKKDWFIDGTLNELAKFLKYDNEVERALKDEKV